ncbi:Meiotically up-regulated gene 84 protein [Erysiphe neolycopersici]|uniref:Meiotically up-regulated gene 84 protein n=1 Tax=Erysiphe neolycopersici TaxID=212602 RepID=A0A420HRQ0_9PEZI|nr:Meiotically up-regulated gene 84 protein [Erysiphe neolycopersici]
MSSSSPSPPLQHTFYPPFYGRPPTPLPPSPSLTSLLRPSRPTTPDTSSSSSSEGDEENKEKKKNNKNKNKKNSTSLPRAAPPIVPTYEYYGFVLYLFSSFTFLIYLLWSYLPSPFLHALGIYYYPNRWWSLALPSFLVMFLLYIYVALATYNTSYLTLPLQSIETIVDEASKVATLDHASRRKERSLQDWREVWDYASDAVLDVPLGGVCEILYGNLKEEKERSYR